MTYDLSICAWITSELNHNNNKVNIKLEGIAAGKKPKMQCSGKLISCINYSSYIREILNLLRRF